MSGWLNAAFVQKEATEFGSEQQLADFLEVIKDQYRDYAAALWASGVRSADDLAQADHDDLITAGISNPIHAWNIKAQAGDRYRRMQLVDKLQTKNKQPLPVAPPQKALQPPQEAMDFANEQQLEEFLKLIKDQYITYAGPLWTNGIISADQLAKADLDDLITAGISNPIHAWNIKAQAGNRHHACRQLITKLHIVNQQPPLQKLMKLLQRWYHCILEETNQSKKNK